jgi:2-keto-3-deoxy-L-rhamnonate aldolase RhmA
VEDIDAVEAINKSVAIQGVDCLFIGRIDLTVAYVANTPYDPRVVEAVERICAAGKKSGVTVGVYVPNVTEENI